MYQKAKVIRVVDGDTALIKSGKIIRGRLIGIDAPESSLSAKALYQSIQHKTSVKKIIEAGELSKSYLKQKLLIGKTIDFLKYGNDIYGRELIWIKILNYQMVQNGYAFAYLKADLPSEIRREIKKAERYAMENKKGIWEILK